MKTLNQKAKQMLRETYEKSCNDFLLALIVMWHWDNSYGYWVGDEVGGVYAYGDDIFIDMADIIYCVENDVEEKEYVEWQEYCVFAQEYKRYLEGNDNALPPKIGNAFKPDDDFIDNRIHRHLIRKMQDAFIEKACNYWYKHNQEMVKRYGSKAILGCSEFTVNVKNFQEYMKGK